MKTIEMIAANGKKISVAVYQSGREDLKALEYARSWANFNHYRISKIYKDKSNGKAMDRPGFKLMMEDAKAHKFDIIITSKLSKFGKSVVALREITNILKTNSIGLDVVDSGIYIDREWKSLMAVLLGNSLEMSIQLQQGRL